MASIEMRGIVKRYGSLEVIPPLDLSIKDHEFVVFVGPSGCGKSTLLRIIAGLEPISGGELLIGGQRVNELSPAARNIAMVFQDYALYPHMTVYGNMAFGLEIRGMKRSEIDERVRRAARMLEIEPMLDRHPKALSGGQRQRVAMGRAMVRDPSVFLFDEPLSNLDAQLRGQVRAEIKALSLRLRNTMIFVTHDQIEAMTMADRIVVLRNGTIQQAGTPEEVYERPENRFVAAFMGAPAMNFLPVTLADSTAQLENGTALPLATPHAGPAILGIRPEHLVPVETGAGIDAELMLVEPLGSDTLVHFEAGNIRCVARVQPEMRPKVGDRMTFGIRPGRAHLFDSESEKRFG
jgi:multiple sugar transport system ATP-binding protein